VRTQPAHPVKLSKVARKRAQQCWSGLLERIAKQARATLGDELWADFVAHANACDKDAFCKPILRCVPPPHGDACPRNFSIDVTCAGAYVTLGELHLDHEQDLVVTCDMWYVGAGARGAPARARARGTTASTARFCSTCSSLVHATTRR
jgi:hypothetical protein